MKLHRNRKKRNNMKRFISLALVCCMTLTMGSSYVSAGEMNPPAVDGGAAVQSMGGVEAVSLDPQEAGDSDINIEGTPSGTEQQSGGNPEAPKEPVPAETPVTPGTPAPGEDTEAPKDPATSEAPKTTEEPASTDAPETTQTPTPGENTEAPAEAPETTETPVPAETPEATEEPAASGAPEETDAPESSEAPEATETPVPVETPEATDAPVQEDYSGNMSIYALFMQPMETAGATLTYEDGVSQNMVSDADWSFDTYYVNEADRYNVTKTDDFSLKYQMEFHASENLAKEAIKIKIDGALLTYRGGSTKASPSDIGVPVAKWDENGAFVANPSRSTSFNYYYEGNGKKSGSYSAETPTLVFYNYKDIPAGTNAAWQVLYSNLKIMDIEDETTWSIKPEVYIGVDKSNKEMNAFTGRVNSSVSLTSVVKTPYYESGKKYTPGLYTLNQLQSYVSNPIDDRYIITEGENSKLNTQDYRYVVWDVKITGNATQPWSLSIWDNPSAAYGEAYGEIVGYKDHSDINTNYNFGISTISSPTGNDPVSSSDMTDNPARKKSWGHRFWVVTAYPADKVLPGDEAQNDITVTLHPQDGKDADEIVTATPASWSYKDYDWHYEGDVISTSKWNGWGSRNDTTEYTGWLEAYRRAKTKSTPEDYGEIPFTVTGHMKGYDVTHQVTGAQLGEYIQGTSYSLTTVDDFLYIKDGNGALTKLEKDDYYFSSVTIDQKDYGYDIYEDKLADSELSKLAQAGQLSGELAEKCGKIEIYAMFSEDANGNGMAAEEWEPVGSAPMDEKGNAKYDFGPEAIARKPYRVKVVHESIDYSTECTIKLAVRLKSDSPVMQGIIGEHNNADKYGESQKYVLENLSGVMGQITRDNKTTAIYATEDGNIDQDTDADDKPSFSLDSATSFNYTGREELKTNTEDLYGVLLVRDNATRTLTWLEMNAQANKKYSAKNDAENNRVLVDYYLTAYDGYLIYDRSCLDYMSKTDEKLISPGRKHVVFYDLLPYGMQFDASTPVTAGRIKELDKNGAYMENPRSWDSTQVSVTVDPSKDIKTNYKGTGRTLVAFHISYSGADPANYTNGKWVEAWGVSFRAYYDWKNMDSVNKDANSNLAAFMPDFNEGYIDEINMANPQLHGLATQVYADNGEMSDTKEAELYKDLLLGDGKQEHKGNIDGNSTYDQTLEGVLNRNVLYANETVNDNIATSSESNIQKLVRADSDIYGAFRGSAMVGKGGAYTYEITVSAQKNSGIDGIVVFDRLESAASGDQQFWQGTFCGVDLSALEKQGITATVYYSDSKDVEITTGKGNPSDILKSENGWYTEEQFVAKVEKADAAEEAAWTDSVQAIAVEFHEGLPQQQSASFRILMKAPADADVNTYAYNQASFSSYPTGKEEERATVTGNPTRVGMNDEETLEIVKRMSGVVPTALQDNEFSFQVFEETATAADGKEKLAFLAYDLYKTDRNGNWVIQNSQPHATDENGYFYLKADEKAVFTVVDASRILVEETANVFWDSNPATGEEAKNREERYHEETTTDADTNETTVTRTKDDNGEIHVRTWTNTFRPVLYVQKELAAVPQGVDKSGETFTFRLQVKKGTGYVDVANAAFWYVDSVLTDGGIPGRVNQNGEPWTEANGQNDPKRTNADGTFTIKQGQIIALFPGVVGTEYRLTEENVDEEGYCGDWYCIRPELTGTVVSEGSSRTITNYYRWKELNLTKEITHQDVSECTQPFTFQITELLLGRDGKPVVDAQGNPTVVMKDKVDGDGNVVVDADGKPVKVVSTAGLEWELVGAEPTGTTTTLSDNGEFTCALAGKTVRIKGLEAGKYYLVKEMPVEADATENVVLYQPVKDSEEFKLLATSTKKDLTFVNDYLKRPLTVKKTVTGEKMGEDEPGFMEPEFTFTVRVNGQPLPTDTPYTVTKQGNVVASGEKDEDGNFVQKIGETIVTGDEAYRLTDGKFILHDGESITFEDAGILGQEFVVEEDVNSDYTQLYPPKDDTKKYTFTGEGGEISFVNGSSNALYISKEYVAKDYNDEVANQLIQEWIYQQVRFLGEDDDEYQPYSDYDSACVSEFILEVTDGDRTYIWPTTDTEIEGINQKNGGKKVKFLWRAGKSIKLPPWIIFSIPIGREAGSISETASYTLTEVKSSQRRIVPRIDWESESTGYVQVTQSYPANFGSISGTVQSAPTATIVNELTSLDGFAGSKIGKRMTAASSEVPTGQKLVWRLERYDEATGKWNPWTPATEGDEVKYAIFDNNGTPMSSEVLSVQPGGRIELEKPEGGYPEVWFVENTVFIDLYDQLQSIGLTIDYNPLLRLVEVPEESGKEWGLLTGYEGVCDGSYFSWGIQSAVSDNSQSGRTEYYRCMLGSEGEVTAYFYNSNSKSSLEIEKYTERPSYQEFTMILEQVVSVNGDVNNVNGTNYEQMLVREPRGGIEYTIHNTDGSEVVGPKNGVTGPGGEIKLRAGQYVILDVPDGTTWTVSEDTYASQNYDLVKLEPEDSTAGGKLVKLTDNLMLVNLPAPIEYKLIYDENAESGVVENMPEPTTTFADGNTQRAQLRVSNKKPLREDYQFVEWSYYVNANGLRDEIFCQGGDLIQMNPDRPTITLKAQWEPIYTVTYHPGEGASPEEVTNLPEPVTQTTNIFTIPKIPPTREGYVFVGWRNGEALQQPSDKISVSHGETRTLYAIWAKLDRNCRIDLYFEGEGITQDKIPQNYYMEVTLSCTVEGKNIQYKERLKRENAKSIENLNGQVKIVWEIPHIKGVRCVYTWTDYNYGIGGYGLNENSPSSFDFSEYESGGSISLHKSYRKKNG